jgi:hypothetical protein
MKTQDLSQFEIVAREDFSDVTYMLEVRHPMMAKAARPGQFVIVMLHEKGERIPLTIADFDRAKGTITLVIQAVGKTTREMQRNCRPGTSLYAVTGPMGIPSHIGQANSSPGSPRCGSRRAPISTRFTSTGFGRRTARSSRPSIPSYLFRLPNPS